MARVGEAGGLGTSPAAVRQVVEVVLVLLLAVQAARLVWAVATPVGPLGTPTATRPAAPVSGPDLSVLERFNPFYRGPAPSVATGAPADAAQLGLRLHGVRGPMFGDQGSAIIAGADGKQVSYLVGETVAPGVVLRAVGGDFAVVVQNGAELRLNLAEFGATAAASPPAPAGPMAVEPPAQGLRLPPPPASAPPGPAAAIDPTRFLAEAGLQPRSQNGRINGYVLNPRGRGDMLRQAGLQPGDVILAFDGRTLENVERLEDMANGIRNNPEAEIRFERGGQVMTTRVRTGR